MKFSIYLNRRVFVMQGNSATSQDKARKLHTTEQVILDRWILARWTKYCQDLYNHKTDGDLAVLECPTGSDADYYLTFREEVPTLREEVEVAFKT